MGKGLSTHRRHGFAWTHGLHPPIRHEQPSCLHGSHAFFLGRLELDGGRDPGDTPTWCLLIIEKFVSSLGQVKC